MSKVTPRGFDFPANSSEKIEIAGQPVAKSVAISGDQGKINHELAAVIAAWPSLSPGQKQAVMALIEGKQSYES
jgi:hypothetical protein